ncbi:hypothetical protein M406DRAFT_347429 [Cryphonectria parasitica EP155]|uniref:BTB domain-containing protein n=1 Tax=Cryphonectria parasitica (strain ATCC 38755 / EP155) TaxID=660469 RepID=A0A9P5CKI3_CRYP1|nr:uncharacterized protein M406DRAFT_347429 [Cryphonectria parasitica EP155]KAF3762274.1 hypothetical protein M406DRAFT_347429 [Cryphonectria parasitica EP155]
MFTKSTSTKQSFSKGSKHGKSSSSFTKESGVSKRRHEHRRRTQSVTNVSTASSPTAASGISPIVTLVIGPEQRIFAAHDDVLTRAPYFVNVLKYSAESSTKRIALPEESPEIFSSVLEYLYKGDYFPRLVHNKKRNTWEMEPSEDVRGSKSESTIYHHSSEGPLLKDTVIYCAAEKYGLEELKRLALRKQGLQCGVQCSTILSSARYAYAHTPETDSKLRAHFLALIIRSRSTFKRSGTMQLEMFNGGTQLFFDLFVALCNHVDDVGAQTSPRTNRYM